MLKRSRSDGAPYTIKQVSYMCICVRVGEIDRKKETVRERDRGGGGEREIDKGRERVSKREREKEEAREREAETGSISII